MARIDLLTAQMRQRAVNRVSVQRDEKMQLFGANDQMLGSGAALPSQTIHEILTEIAPMPIDGAPVAFPYGGRDGEFEISVAPEGRGFEIRTLSFAPAANEPFQNHVAPPLQNTMPEPASAVAPVAPSNDEWFYATGDQQIGPHTSSQIKGLIRSGVIRRNTFLWQEGMSEWQAVGNSEFKNLLTPLPNAKGDPDNTWYYRSMTGQAVPVNKSVLVEKIRSGELTGDSWVWHEGMVDWASASSTELASAVAARPMGLPPVGAGAAPIASPTGGPRTLPGSGPYDIYGGGDPANTSGGGDGVEIPREARGLFNLGAFLFPVFWCHAMGMQQWATGIFVFNIASRYIPFVGLVKIPLCLYLGYMGNSLAWRHRRFNSVEDFKKCQMIWGIASGAIWALIIFIGIAFYVSVGSSFKSASSSMSPPTAPPMSSPSGGGN
ncbi:DUF4339 domain-containing protein [bacterium]|nr:MAG: DUF4339 domain-containing protein [bacterium]